MKVAVLDDYQHVAMKFADWSRLGPDIAVTVFDRNLATVEEAARALADFEVISIMRERMPVSAALLDRLPKLRLVVTTGARNRSIDLAATARHNVLVCHTGPGESDHATPELAWGLMLACARNIALEDRRLRSGAWQTTLGRTLHGSTLGILGLGRLGQEMARLGQAFGMNVIAWSQNLTPEKAASAGAGLVSREELFAQSDFLTIHLVLSERTRGLVGRADLARMKRSAVLINTARGPILDEAALIDALRDGTIRGAGLDVFDREPLPSDHPLRSLENVVMTPHVGYVTEEAYRMFYDDTVEAIVAWREGRPIRVLAAET